MIIFEKLALDPNGWIRHIIVGIIILLIGLYTKQITISFIVCLILAFLKEYSDYIVMGRFIIENSLPDILFTILPYGIYYLLYSNNNISSNI